MPQRNTAAVTSCVFEGTHGADGGTLPETKNSRVPSRWTGRCARGEPGRILVRFRDPSWGQALAGTCALGGPPIGYGVGKVEPCTTGADALR
jgi:hypothetical protein